VAQITKEHDGAKSKARSHCELAAPMISNAECSDSIPRDLHDFGFRLPGSRT
jgi:hypothetical protein